MYSSIVLTDDNFDDELEKLCASIKLNLNSSNSFVDKLEEDFELQNNNGKEEWIRCETIPNISSDCRQVYQKGQLAYEFANGFIVLDYEVLL